MSTNRKASIRQNHASWRFKPTLWGITFITHPRRKRIRLSVGQPLGLGKYLTGYKEIDGGGSAIFDPAGEVL